MLAGDARFEGFTATDWTRVLSLFQPRHPEEKGREASEPRGGVFAVHEGGVLRKLVHSERGRLSLDDAPRPFPCSAEELARLHHASYAVILETGTLEEIMDRFAERTRHGDDMTAQALTILSAIREQLEAGRMDVWPEPLLGTPLPTAGILRGSLDTVCPVNRTLVLGLFDSGELWTSIALRRGPQGFDLFLGPDELREDLGLLTGDFRRDYPRLSRAIEKRCGPLAFGCYAEAETIRALEVDPNPGAWARAFALRKLVLSPLPAALAVPLAIDAGRALLGVMERAARSLDRLGVFGFRDQRQPPEGPMRNFQPLEVLRRLLTRES